MAMETESTEMTFAEAFDADLRTSGLEQSKVCELLSVDDPIPISSAAISNWKKRNSVPLNRLEKLIEIFGGNSQMAEWRNWLLGQPTFSRKTTATAMTDEERRARWANLGKPKAPPKAPPAEKARHYIKPDIQPHGGIRWSEVVSSVRRRLPEEYGSKFDLEFVIGEIGARFDFIGDNSVISFTRLSSLMMGSIYRPMFRMAMIRKLMGTSSGHRFYVIVLTQERTGTDGRTQVFEPADTARHLRVFRRVATEARIMGIVMVLAENEEKAAEIIVSLESNPYSGSEEEEEEDD